MITLQGCREEPKELRTTFVFQGTEVTMTTTEGQNSNSKPICNIPLCGKEADWEVELFGKAEYYCMKHRPGVPEKFMVKLKTT